MSYSHEIKREICANKLLRQHSRALCYGMALFGKSYDGESICLHTEHRVVARLYGNLLSDLTGLCGSITSREVKRPGRRSVYVVTVDAPEDRAAIYSVFGDRRIRGLSEEEEPAFLSGAFLACGAVSDPEKGYRVEFATPEKTLRDDLAALLFHLAPPKFTTRRNDYVVYYKESEHIEDLLTCIGAPKSSMKLMEVKIMKGLRNQVNRTTNCETANISKTVDAALAQIAAISRIEKSRGLDSLDEELRTIALLRRDNPELSLRELGEQLSLSRSAVNRKLQRIMEIAAKI